MDWTLTGAVAGVTVLAGVVAYESFAFLHSSPEPATDHASAVLIPARERPAAIVNAMPGPPVVAYAPPEQGPAANVNAMPSPPAVAYASPQQTKPTDISNYPVAAQHLSRLETPAPVQRMNPTVPGPTLNRPPPADYGSSAYNVPVPAVGRPPPADYGSSAHNGAKTQSQVSSDIWKVVRTAKASFFNLGGHIDNNGVVDSLASSYLRNALKNQRNYAKLPPQIKTYIDAPNINLAMIAGYRGLLGVDDRKMEEEQGVKFIRVASRGIEITGPNGDLEDLANSIDAPPLDLSPLERMASDLRREMTQGVPR